MGRELRKQQNLLVDAGTGVMLFAVWSVVKVNAIFFSDSDFLRSLHSTAVELDIDEKFFLFFMIFIIAAVLFVYLIVRLYIGWSAMADGKGNTRGWSYLVLAGVLVVTDLQSSWQALDLERILAGEELSIELITAICMDAASIYVLIELLISGIRVKYLRKKMKV